ncbi:hypothetical protein BU24DRAFT_430904 [Aaosphaeria arxii CBS 175.79]|uniref:Zn(2)-C6 fungal-type domain-containing protein n=1 Tax=Aaosphaeria arxii CBS 175.79 TaxID=1450172 RepID=A0A6A5Y0R0_9PLEO|nr:uncharacterized protein BU24DRAFT_430904 [Aaosphaeria arxii CBS 175.79]KAF2018816.1 hypothetical protein BU24DRAFT_430904 [Aaosphaeria arxii CBS 175.79]
MSTRRTHNKTRLGCGQCKKRRIKCDETHPTCNNCVKKGFDCSFLLLAPSTRLTTSITSRPITTPISSTSPTSKQLAHISPSPSRSSTGSSPSTSDSQNDGLSMIPAPKLLPGIQLKDVFTEFRGQLANYHELLLGQYKETTCLTLATDDPGKSAWQVYVPQMANEHSFLIHGIFSVTSLHLSQLHESAPEREKLRNIAADQMNRAIAQFRLELENINKSNAPALFACSTLTAVYFFRTSVVDLEEVQAAIPPDIPDPPVSAIDKSIDSIIRTFWALRGALSVLAPGWEWVVDSKMSPVCHRTWWPEHRLPASARAVEEDRRLAQLEKLWTNLGRGNEMEHDSLSAALGHLRNTYALVSMLTDPEMEYPTMNSPVPYSVDDTTVGMLRDRAAILVWATRLSKMFIQMVETKRPEALVVTAHYAVLLGRVRNVWWMDGLGAGMLRGIAMALGRENLHLIEWPAQVLGVDVESRFGLDQLAASMRAI